MKNNNNKRIFILCSFILFLYHISLYKLNILHINNNKYIMYLLYNFLFLHIEYSKNCTNTILFIIKHKI
ncbi:hypothetical protein C923_04931 [Plasmodium falciparum UGT5.1]|uniref:Uncharacterized protein n=9 Tax=Plasmodium falciparum TaxID=5833 RepID=W7KA53_PLAFO|nr:hypothetical protein PFFVO_04451 [Plasmodium falciparum Vietnam Oak-Knoll (FVO)]ETW28299.1 hypothetical protein PFFCH_04207 [Plasmodium falciparum FCH/4]ETW40709.1 hypothetical protein PFNF135_05013 [Plasmodium falciparum NF135/5.C10]ETW47332.1 hypothetical protein PFMALIP_04681 [Plasmodium falciparum MaliPS096_E11]ETW55711.1 hypothetical protein PFUGPA_02473 [Plasmodium falciparum Palo Alto/Uganda]ETW59320.1 hypothetical protein PFMC_04797 [Plasmodium falciparum CAMP/Malaysia]EUR65253.1 h